MAPSSLTTSPFLTEPSPATAVLFVLSSLLGAFALIFNLCWLATIGVSLISRLPTTLMGPDELCPEHATLSRFAFTLFTPCATDADMYFVTGFLSTVGSMAMALIAWSLHINKHKNEQLQEEAAETIELPNRRARSTVDEERDIGISTPPPAYDRTTSSSSPTSSLFVPTPSSTASTSTPLPIYETPRRTPTCPGVNRACVPVRVSSEGEHVNDWRGKWNARVKRMERGRDSLLVFGR
ncbi:MAG: hypothetical protein LQ343_005213 [Gyalolechia ehrenbergii]|nr:MAG: hypothetical protein LQ343_005213 [Gyalolechia ehrenbergii]